DRSSGNDQEEVMNGIIYENFDLLILPLAAGEYQVKVLQSGGGDVNGTFSLRDLATDFAGEANGQVGDHNRHFGDDVAPNARLTSVPPDYEAAKTFGGRLFNAVFPREIYAAFKQSRDQARNRKRLRIRVNLTAVPQLACLPWEY